MSDDRLAQARAEAERRWPGAWEDTSRVKAFMTGVEWADAHPDVTPEELVRAYEDGQRDAVSKGLAKMRITAALTSHQHPTPLGSSGKCNHTQRGITWAEQGTTAYACNTCEHEWTERD